MREAWLDAFGVQARKAEASAVLLVALETPAQRRESERERVVKRSTDQGVWRLRKRRGLAPRPPAGEPLQFRPRIVLTDVEAA